MSGQRKTGEVRKKELRLAISRIKRGRAVTKEAKLTIASVAREAGVSPALIHNYHPEIAEAIRGEQSGSSRAQRDAKHQELKAEREKNRALRAENDILRAQIAKLTSINEVLLVENRDFKARNCAPNVVDLGL